MTTNKRTAAATQITEIVLPGRIEASGLQIRHRTLPAPAAGQVLIQVEASGISFAEQAMRRAGILASHLFHLFPDTISSAPCEPLAPASATI